MSGMKKLLRNQKGQGVMEYVILSGLIGIFCLVAIKGLGRSLNGEIKKIKTKVEKIVEAE